MRNDLWVKLFTAAFLPGEPQWRRSLVGCRLWGHRVGHDWGGAAAAAAFAAALCCCSSVVSGSVWTRHCSTQATLSSITSRSLLKPMSIELVMPPNHLILCCPFSSCLQSFPASGSFPMSQLFPSGGQSIGASASVSVLPMNIQDWFPLGWTCLIFLQSKGLSSLFSNTTSKASVLCYIDSRKLTVLCAVLCWFQLFATPQSVVCQAPCPWDCPGKNTGGGCHFLLQGIFPAQGWNQYLLHLLHCRQILHYWATGEAPGNSHERLYKQQLTVFVLANLTISEDWQSNSKY